MTDTKKIKVMLVDDHAIVRQGLRTYLELVEDFEIVGEAPNGMIAVERAAALQPDVILMDLVMPDMDGISATRQLKDNGSKARVIVLTSFAEDSKVIPAIQAGATSFLLKDVTPGDLCEAVRAAYKGEARLHPSVTRKLMDEVIPQPLSGTLNRKATITAREMEVLRLIAAGMSNKQIASRLVISEKTVKTHVSALLSKLDLADRTQLAIYAVKQGYSNTD
jgi:two-component system, NarL family, response regulator LiaR